MENLLYIWVLTREKARLPFLNFQMLLKPGHYTKAVFLSDVVKLSLKTLEGTSNKAV